MTRVFHPALSGPEQSRYQITDVASVSRSGLCINESPIRDRCGRTMGDLRLSVIDQCNLRCRYCMPEAEYAWLPRADLLSVDEISLIVDAFIAVGVDKIRLTGGEPLIRSDLAAIIEVISAKVGDGSGLQDLAITTNGVLLADQAIKLKSAGMRRITISLDTLRPDRFKAISQRGTHYKVIEGIEAVAAAGFTDTKLDSVVIRGFNDDELSDLIEFARNVNAEVRFIEYKRRRCDAMVDGQGLHESADAVNSREEIRSHRGLAEVRFRAREPLQIAGRNNIRHHCFDHRAILCNL